MKIINFEAIFCHALKQLIMLKGWWSIFWNFVLKTSGVKDNISKYYYNHFYFYYFYDDDGLKYKEQII